MAYLGNAPTSVPLSSADILDSAITSAKIANGSVTIADLSATGTASSSTFLRGDNVWGSAGGTNTPAFSAVMSSNLTLNNGTDTKLILNSEIFDTDSAFDSTTNYRFTVPSGKAGKYLFLVRITGLSSWNSRLILYIFKNGSGWAGLQMHHETSENGNAYSVLGDCSVGDYFEVYAMQDSGSSRTLLSTFSWCEFSGFKLL